jgi:hypothetical protein
MNYTTIDLKVGDRVVVDNILHTYSFVQDIIWLQSEYRYQINLVWKDIEGNYVGNSKVFSSDEGKSWFKFEKLN